MRLNELYQNNQTTIEEGPLDWAKGKVAKRAGAKITSKESELLYRQIQKIASQAGIEEPTVQQLVQIFAKAGQTNAKQVSRAINSVGYPVEPGDTSRGQPWDVIKQVVTKLSQTQALSTQAPAKIDPALIDAIKKLTGAQKTALGNILLGKG